MSTRGKRALLIRALIAFAFLGAACRDGSGGSGGANLAPLAEILFPPAGSQTDAGTITVIGTATDAQGVAEVRVNGVLATTSDGFAHWRASVPLVSGENTLTVELHFDSDPLLPPPVAAVTLDYGTLLVVTCAVTRTDGIEVRRDAAGRGKAVITFTKLALRKGEYRVLEEADRPQSIGRLGAQLGNAGVLLRAYVYARLLGPEGMRRVAEFSTLNANYLMALLRKAGFEIAFPRRRASHEFIVTLRRLKEETGVTALDVAKRLLDKGFHAPTIYFPLLVPECLLIEPTETESKQTLDAFAAAMAEILAEARSDPQLLKTAPHTTPVRRLDDVKAARVLDLAWTPGAAR